MQLEKASGPPEKETPKIEEGRLSNIASLIAIATCSLFAATPAAADTQLQNQDNMQQSGRKWTTQGAVLSYSEDGRVTVNQAQLKFKGEDEKGSLQFQLGYDVVSGPSENGAMPSPEVQTFTSPSGKIDYAIMPGELPWYEIDRHPREEVSISKTTIFSSEYSVNYGARYSTEATYISRSLNGGITRNSNQKNTQHSFLFSYESASIRPYGGATIPLAEVVNRSSYSNEDDFIAAWNELHYDKHKEKDTYSLAAGLTQIVNKNILMQFDYSYSETNGYQTDSQKVVSVIDADGLVLYNVYENRPDERIRQSIYWKGLFSAGKKTVFDINYRYYWDSWSIDSHTLSAGLQYELSDRLKIEPQFRWYGQSKANFFRHAVFTSVPSYLSADYRLGATTNYTLGVNLDYHQPNNNVISLRVAVYDINPKRDKSTTSGYLNEVDVAPDITATMISLSYEF